MCQIPSNRYKGQGRHNLQGGGTNALQSQDKFCSPVVFVYLDNLEFSIDGSKAFLEFTIVQNRPLMHRKCLATARKYTNKNQHALCKHLGLKQITVQITSTRLVSYKQQPHAFSPVTTSTSAVPTPPPQCLCFYNIFDSKLHKHHCTYDSVVWQVQRQHISRKCTHNKSMHLPLQKLPLEPPFNLYDNEMQPVLPMTRVTD